MTRVIALLWACWGARNETLFQGITREAPLIIAKDEAIYGTFKMLNQPAALSNHSWGTVNNRKWTPPEGNWLKVNTDAATNKENEVAGLGTVLRDSRGSVLACAMKTSRFYGDVESAAAEALFFGIKCVLNAGFLASPIVFESNAKSVVSLVQGKIRSYTERIISEIHNEGKKLNSLEPLLRLLIG